MNKPLKHQNNEYSALLNVIPGAVLQCLNDDAFTITEFNQGFLDLSGFTEDELMLQFHKSFLEMIHSSDREAVLRKSKQLSAKSGGLTLYYRILCQNGLYKWVIDNRQLLPKENDSVQLISVILDITESKAASENLRRRAERDALTGLYNREETEGQIRRHLENNPGSPCALFMIDTDNFKQINDRQGHLFGDMVLSEMAAGMKKITRQTDVAGRIGGDEFAIFFKDIPSTAMITEKAGQLLAMFKRLFQNEKQPIEITCSIGIALYPDGGQDFQSLYRSADLALYQAKSLGKNQYVLFDKKEPVSISQIGYSSLDAALDSDLRDTGDLSSLVNYVFQILFDAIDLELAIQMILEIAGKRFDVSRAYIFENSEDGKYSSNTYEWCNTGIVPQKNNLQNYPYSELEGYEDLFKDNSIFYCRDIYTLKPSQVALFESQGIRSTLQCAIRNENRFCGFVGFDECTGLRLWTKEEISMLSLISQLLTTFLQKKRMSDRDRQLAVKLNTLLDTQDAYIYTIRRDTYELLYLNKKTTLLDSGAKTGMTCHQAFFGQSTPCENCPLTGGDGEMYNPKYNVWTRVRVAPMKWDDYEAYLLTCFDITEYKRLQEKSPDEPEKA